MKLKINFYKTITYSYLQKNQSNLNVIKHPYTTTTNLQEGHRSDEHIKRYLG